MTRSIAVAVLLVAVATVASVRHADACSVRVGYLPPTNVELVASTPQIVVARAFAEIRGAEPEDRRIALKVTRILRGTAMAVGDRIEVHGMTGHCRGASKPNDFSRARPGAYAGSCIAVDYAIGRHYLLLLRQYDGKWEVGGAPFTRVNEEVNPAGDSWTAAVTEYVRIAGLITLADRRTALEALVARGRAKGASPRDRAIADDVAHHLTSPTPYKSFAELEPMYEDQSAGRAKVITAIGEGADPAARVFMRRLVADLCAGTPPVDAWIALRAVFAYYINVADPAAVRELGDHYLEPAFGRKDERRLVMALLVKRADASFQALMERALASVDNEEAARLAGWFVAHPSVAAQSNLHRRLGGFYPTSSPMALALSGMGDPDVVAWARQQVSIINDDKKLWLDLAPCVIARSPLAEADAVAGAIIERGGPNLIHLIECYDGARHPAADRRLAEIGRRIDLSAKAKGALTRTADERKPR